MHYECNLICLAKEFKLKILNIIAGTDKMCPRELCCSKPVSRENEKLSITKGKQAHNFTCYRTIINVHTVLE
jgi:hypothetical protein